MAKENATKVGAAVGAEDYFIVLVIEEEKIKNSARFYLNDKC